MASKFDQIRWKKISDTQWQSNNERGFVGTITHTPVVGPTTGEYALQILPGPVDTTHLTFRNAKNQLRKFLFDKPVVV